MNWRFSISLNTTKNKFRKFTQPLQSSETTFVNDYPINYDESEICTLRILRRKEILSKLGKLWNKSSWRSRNLSFREHQFEHNGNNCWARRKSDTVAKIWNCCENLTLLRKSDTVVRDMNLADLNFSFNPFCCAKFELEIKD